MTNAQQNLLLELLDALSGQVGATDFQKLLFLYTREYESTPSYDFVPYRFGCFSFTATADCRRLVERGLLADGADGWQLTTAGRAHASQRRRTSGPVAGFMKRYGSLRGHRLLAEVYRRYPYYATRSRIVDQVLPPGEREAVTRARPPKLQAGLLTIGYEGRSLENYLNTLLRASVALLCDVRANPLSRKYGFSKKTLAHACEGVGIRYEHAPELGIASADRRGLETQAAYDRLFARYRKETLPQQPKAVARIGRWIAEDGQRVALTCFELLPEQCHRHCVANEVQRQSAGSISVAHL